jgi:hypothetical protein|nr:MAG TPA: Kruppel-like factor 3 finger, kruppel-like, DNA BINDING [Caudoviricetes sp.]
MENKGCNTCKYEHCDNQDYPCSKCSHAFIDKYEPKTNADKIREMSDEELAEFLDIVGEDGISSQYADIPCDCCCEKTECSKCWKEWLQSEAE